MASGQLPLEIEGTSPKEQHPISKFVIAMKNIQIAGGIMVEKDDVGIIESDTEESPSIFFVRIGQNVTLSNDAFTAFEAEETGDAFDKKICNVCHKLLDTTQFARNQNAINNRPVRRPSCKTCRAKLEGINSSPKEKEKWESRKPNNVPFECPICGKRTIAGVTSKIVLDHSHKNGTVRGWICDSCNTGIGRFKDDVELLKRAIKYIE